MGGSICSVSEICWERHYQFSSVYTSICSVSGTKTPEEWERKVQMLKNYPAKFPGRENNLFSRLAFNYDSLRESLFIDITRRVTLNHEE